MDFEKTYTWGRDGYSYDLRFFNVEFHDGDVDDFETEVTRIDADGVAVVLRPNTGYYKFIAESRVGAFLAKSEDSFNIEARSAYRVWAAEQGAP